MYKHSVLSTSIFYNKVHIIVSEKGLKANAVYNTNKSIYMHFQKYVFYSKLTYISYSAFNEYSPSCFYAGNYLAMKSWYTKQPFDDDNL